MSNTTFEFMPKHITYNYLKDQYKKGNRIVVSRYGDGEYFLIKGKRGNKKTVSRQIISTELKDLMISSVKTKGQLVCLPAKKKINEENLNETENIKLTEIISKHIIKISDQTLYGSGRWRMIDSLRNKSELITNFFLGETLVLTAHKRTAEIAFASMNNIDVFEVPIRNACGEHENIKKYLVSVCDKYRNIIFACGPLSNILIADLISCCDSHLIDLGSVVDIIINPYSVGIPVARRWAGLGRKGDPKIVKRCSVDFFNTLNMKLEKR